MASRDQRSITTDSKPETFSQDESTDEIELRPDGEKRFLAAVRAAAKSGPKHRPSKKG